MPRTVTLAARATLVAGMLLAACVATGRAQSGAGRAAPASAPEPPAAAPEPIDECQIIAQINGIPVTACEVLWEANLVLEKRLEQVPPAQRSQIPPEELDKLRRKLVKRFLASRLDMKILYGDFLRSTAGQADLNGIHSNLDKPFNEHELPSIMKRVGVEDQRELPARLAELGTSLWDLRQDFYQREIARSWVGEKARGSGAGGMATREELLAYYQQHATDYDFPTQARWEELMVRFDRFGGKDKAYEALCRLGNQAFEATAAANGSAPSGGSTDGVAPAFEALAKSGSQGFTASDGGAHKWTTQGALAAERIDEALFTLPVGQMSPILESDQGFHIVRVLERRLAGRTPFTEVQEEIRKKLRDEQLGEAYQVSLDEIRRSATIWTLFDGYIDADEYATARSPKGKRTRR